MNEITITLSLRDAGTICRVLSKADPLKVFTGDIIHLIDVKASEVIRKAKDTPVATPVNSMG